MMLHRRKFPRLLFEACEGLTDEQKEKFFDLLYKLSVEGKKFTKKKWKSIFENDRFLMYVAQIRMDGQDPADILETWLKEHNPDHFKDPAKLTESAT